MSLIRRNREDLNNTTDTDRRSYNFLDYKRSYYKYGTEPNASIVGSFARIDRGVASGFSTSQYLTLPKTVSDYNNLEVNIKIKASSLGTLCDCLRFENGGVIFLHTNNYLGYDPANVASTLYPEIDTWYYIKFTHDSSTYTLSCSLDGREYIDVATSQSTTKSTGAVYVGGSSIQTARYWRGSIDLNSSYIKINGEIWWHGTKAYQINVSGEDVWEKWEQPILTSDGVLGGNSFACQMLNNPVNSAYLAFDGNTSTNARINSGASSSSSFTFYNPEPLKISTIIINASGNNNNEYMSAGKLYGSNDNSSWTELLTFSGLSYGDYTLAVNSDKSYKYHKFMPTSLCTAGYWTLAELKITAQKLMATGTIEDADYYLDSRVMYNLIKRRTREYYKRELSQRDTGTYTFTLGRTYVAELLFVGNGGGGSSSQRSSRWYYTGGGSGAVFEGKVILPPDTYTLTIGTLGYSYNIDNVAGHSNGLQSTDSFLVNSSGEELIRVGAGKMGTGTGSGGAAGVLTLGSLDIVSTKKAKDGNAGGSGSSNNFALSAYDNTKTGYGAGTGSVRYAGNVYGIAGIFDLVLQTDIDNYDWYKDVGTKFY